ncbi:MAG: lipoprotein [Gallionellaceae bacterium]
MKHARLFAVLFALALAACGQKSSEAPASQPPAAAPSASLPAGHPPVDVGKMAQAAPGIALTQKGQVLSTIDVPQYTYIEVTQDNKTRWLAATTVAVKKGDTIQFDDGATMTNFTSKTLNRTFPSITFVVRVVVLDGKA